MAACRRPDVELWWERVGAGPAVLLVPGRGDSADVYPRCFVDPLVAAGHSVIRFDPRDTGRSGDGGTAYTLADMADDAVAVLDAAGTDRCDVVGFSMGGLLLADLAVRHRDRVGRAVFLSAMSLDPEAGMGDDFFAYGDDPETALLRAMGPASDDDRAWVRSELEHAAQRAPARPDAAERHQAAAFRSEWGELGTLAGVDGAVLVVHGDGDRVLPVAHGRAIADAVPDGRLVVMPGMGHYPRPAEWRQIATTVVDHLTTQT